MSADPKAEESQETQENGYLYDGVDQVFTDERPKAGERREGEPTPEEVARAVNNEPDPEFPVKIGSHEFLLIDLTSEDWLSYVAAFLPPLETIVKEMTPLMAVVVRGIAIFRNLTPSNVGNLKTVAQAGDYQLLSDSLQKLGISANESFDINTLETLIAASKVPGETEFYSVAMTVFMKPLFAPALVGLEQVSISNLILKVGAKLSDLVWASIHSTIVKNEHEIQNEPDWQIKLKQEIKMMDGFDQFDVVSKQFELYQKGGKPRNFFVQMMRMIPMPRPSMNISSGTPSA